MKKGDERRIYLDLLRIVACVAVVFFHICGKYISFYQVNEYERILSTSIVVLTGFAVPTFLMISGALFLDKAYPVNIKKIFSKNILKLLVIYFVWSIMYLLVCKKAFTLTEVINGHYHLWYIPTIISIYIAVPLLKPIAEDNKLLKYFCILSFGMNCVLLYIRMVSMLDPLEQTIDKFMSHIPSGYIFYFVLGYAVANYEFSRMLKRLIYVMTSLDCIFVISLTVYFCGYKGIQLDCLYSNFSISRFLISIAMFIFLKDKSKQIKNEKVFRGIKYVSECTLGIYLIHDFVIQYIDSIMEIKNLNPAWAIILVGAGVFVISFILVVVIKKIPVIGKIIV